MAGEHILGWPIAVVRDRRVVAVQSLPPMRRRPISVGSKPVSR